MYTPCLNTWLGTESLDVGAFYVERYYSSAYLRQKGPYLQPARVGQY